PFTHEVSQVLRLHNPTADPVAFKVKTTAPKQYVTLPFLRRAADTPPPVAN
ncbi:phosphatidylinositol-binding protein scs2, partial [Friedmanniomyces endolithicus]